MGGSPPKPPKVTPPKQTDAAESNAAQAERLRRRRAQGMQSTILAGDSVGAPAVNRKTLLGV